MVKAMIPTPAFEYEHFMALTGIDVAHYMEPIINDPATPVSLEALKRIAAEMDNYDEYHLVYAIELGPDRAPDLFTPLLPQYLANESVAVCCAAERAFRRIPDHYITRDLLECVQSLPTTTMYIIDPVSLERRAFSDNTGIVTKALEYLTKRKGDIYT